MKKKALLALLVLLILTCECSGALASPGDAVLFPQALDGSNGENIQSVAVLGDTLYLLGYNGLYSWQTKDAEPKLVSDQVKPGFAYAKWSDMPAEDQEKNKNSVNILFQNGGKLYGLNNAKGALLLLDVSESGVSVSEAAVLDWESMFYQEADYTANRQIFSSVLTDDRLYLLVQQLGTDNWNDYDLLVYDLKTGAQSTIAIPNVHAIAPYKNGQLLCNVYDSENMYTTDGKPVLPTLSVLDPATQALTKMADFPAGQVGGLYYDAEKDTVYALGKGELYGLAPGGAFETVAYLPVDYPGDQLSAAMMPGGLYAVANNNGSVYVRNTDPALKSDRVLRIAGGYSDNVSQAFQNANASIPVIFMDQYFSNAEEISQNMVSGSDSADLFLLDLSYGGFSSLRDKGFAADLSNSAVLTQAVSKMYPQFVQSIFKDGKLIAFPYQLNSFGLGYSPDVLKEIGLDQPPKTLMELMDLYVDWVETYSTQFPNYTISENIYDVRQELLNTIFLNYLAYYAKSGEELAFDTPLFRSLLSKLDEIAPLLEELNPSEEEQQNGYVTYSGEDGMTPTALFTNMSINPQGYDDGRGYQPLFLALDEGLEPTCFAQIQAFVVNPNSKNQDLALQYLEYYANNMPREVSITFCPDDNTPVKRPGIEKELAQLEKDIANLQEQLKTAKPEDVKLLEETLKSQQEYLARVQVDSYMISEKTIAQYRSLVPYICVDTENLDFLTSSKEALTLLSRFLQGELETNQFVKEFDRKLQMMRMEGN